MLSLASQLTTCQANRPESLLLAATQLSEQATGRFQAGAGSLHE